MQCCAQVTRVEYVLLWGTYISIMLTDLEAGIGIGIILSTLYFTFSYAKARAMSPRFPRQAVHAKQEYLVCAADRMRYNWADNILL